ncbi:N-acetylmuramoyl-L-alanine amidase [Pseudonocardiaceae bacterium YIM PH 21723]|nr:N-acetylmuramoyl-L-alanine amidase [Pseudonocardiaceae bacterium YIM PH 21723]
MALGGLLSLATGRLDLGDGDWQPLHRCRAGRDDRRPGSGFPALSRGGGPRGTGEIRTFRGFPYVTRAGWGCDPTLGPDWPAEYSPLQLLTVHHTAIRTTGDPAADVRAVHHYHAVTQDWGDIGYHLLIDRAGVVYEGRFSGPDPAPVFGPAGRPVVAGHAYGYNPGNIGVCLLGDFTDEAPTPPARRSLVRVLAALCALGRLDPQGTVHYRHPGTGAVKEVPAISRHRDLNETECPGNVFAQDFAGVRTDVARLLGTAAR